MFKFSFSLVLLALLVIVSPATAQTTKKESKNDKSQTTLVGYLSDCQCGESLESVKMAAEHTKECCLMDACAKSGFGIYSGGKFIKFDPKGSDKAKNFLIALKQEKDLKVKVKGKMENDMFMLASIESSK
ncbi:MAG: hypothetical protein SNJ55_05610 [Chloroherpetonaceae bacterium]